MNSKILDYYATPSRFTTFTGAQLVAVRALPNDIEELVRIVQGVLIHRFVAEFMYDVHLPKSRDAESHLRHVSEIYEGIQKLHHAPLTEVREPAQRLSGVCHHFAKLLVSILRAKGVPARMRYGFGAYFNAGYFEDHSLCEVWDKQASRWRLVDPQFDERWQQSPLVKHDVLDVPRDQLLTADDAWRTCRAGARDAGHFGIMEMRGLWFIAGNLVKDIAALNKMELLQWDAWTGMPRPNNSMLNKKTLAHFDVLAELLHDPDAAFSELQTRYADPAKKLAVPDRVFNAMHRHLENI